MTVSNFIQVFINTSKRTPFRPENMIESTFRVHSTGKTSWHFHERPSLLKKLSSKAVLAWEQAAARIRYSPTWNFKRRMHEPRFGKTAWEKPSRDELPTLCICGDCDGTPHLPPNWGVYVNCPELDEAFIKPGSKVLWRFMDKEYDWEDRAYQPLLDDILEEEGHDEDSD
jgi:hypothetical protein